MKDIDMNKLRENILKSREKKGGNDSRFLNYYDLDFGARMTIRLLPDGGDTNLFWLKYGKHGPNLRNPGVDGISCCYTSRGEKCPVCLYGFALKNDNEEEEAKKWRGKTSFIGQCIVVDSPIEVNQSEDGNLVKLIHLPFKVKEEIEDAIVNGTVDDIMASNFVIRKTKNAGGKASYEKSFFQVKEQDLPNEVVKSLGEGTSYLYDLSKELPEYASPQQLDEWLVEAKRIVYGTGTSTENTKTEPAASVSSKDSVPAEKEATEPSSESGNVSAKDLLSALQRKST